MKLARERKEQQGQSYIRSRTEGQTRQPVGKAGLVIPATTGMATSSEEEVHQQNCVSLEEIQRYAIPN